MFHKLMKIHNNFWIYKSNREKSTNFESLLRVKTSLKYYLHNSTREWKWWKEIVYEKSSWSLSPLLWNLIIYKQIFHNVFISEKVSWGAQSEGKIWCNYVYVGYIPAKEWKWKHYCVLSSIDRHASSLM